jgi:pyruvate,water dikinase
VTSSPDAERHYGTSPRAHPGSSRGDAVAVDVVEPALIRDFSTLALTDVELAGGKGANLGELTRAGFPVPPGFVVTAPAYLSALERTGVRQHMRDLASSLNVDDLAALQRASAELRQLVRTAGIPETLARAITAAYRALGPRMAVAVRSSATAEDSAGTSFAGMNETFTNVIGEAQVLEKVVACWMSLWSPRVIAYRARQGVKAEPAIAVVVQTMVDAERAGVAFTADPSTSDRSRIVVDAAFGLGEVVVSGQVEPDTYVLSKSPLQLRDVRIGRKGYKIVRVAGREERVDLAPEQSTERVLDDAEVLALARLSLRVEEHYGRPQDLEWAFVGAELFLLQSRPITTLSTAESESGPAECGRPLVSGLGASPGTATGKVRILRSPSEGSTLQPGEVLIAPMTTPDWVPFLRRAAALVTDSGGTTCHAAIVSRELRIPCVVGTRKATQVLRPGDLVRVDGSRGTVTAGELTPIRLTPEEPSRGAEPVLARAPEPTATKILVNLAIASEAEHAAKLPVDGVGDDSAPRLGQGSQATSVDHGRGSLGRVLASGVQEARRPRHLHRLERSHSADARSRP